MAFVVDYEGKVVYANRAVGEMLGVDLDNWIGCDAMTFLHPDDVALVISSLESVEGNGRGTPIEIRARDREGRWRWLEVIGRDCTQVEGILGVLCTARDLTERRMWEVGADDVARFQQVVQHSAAIIMRLDPRGVVAEVNGAFGRLLGHDPTQVIGRELADFVAEEDKYLLRHGITEARLAQPATVEVSMRMAGGPATVPVRFEIVSMRDDPVVAGLIVTGQDVSDLRDARARLEYVATHDALTGLANRALMDERLAEATSAGTSLALLYVDLDGFKQVNDGLGHSAGDELLFLAAQRLSGAVPCTDTVARVGGDEFVVLAMGVETMAGAETVGRRVRRVLSEPYRLASGVARIRASVGVVLSAPGRSAAELMRLADLDMYALKTGRPIDLTRPETSSSEETSTF